MDRFLARKGAFSPPSCCYLSLALLSPARSPLPNPSCFGNRRFVPAPRRWAKVIFRPAARPIRLLAGCSGARKSSYLFTNHNCVWIGFHSPCLRPHTLSERVCSVGAVLGHEPWVKAESYLVFSPAVRRGRFRVRFDSPRS